jgi:inner membrane protein
VDNLTHSLVGALMGRIGLKRLTPLAMSALIVSANLPDIDSFVAPLFGVSPRVAHRGFTHGVGGLILLPFVTAAIILLWQRFRPSKEGRVRLGGLLFVCFLGGLSHSALDYLTGYGTRLLEPFSHRWFYGDTLFIVDPWIWIMLILGLEFSWRAERNGRNWTRPATWAFAAVLGYIAVNAAITFRSVALTRPLVERVAQPRLIVASEEPLLFWRRHMLWRGAAIAGSGEYDPAEGLNHIRLDPRIVPLRLDEPELARAARTDPKVRDFLFWSRMPVVTQLDGRLYLGDQRFPALRHTGFLLPLDKR